MQAVAGNQTCELEPMEQRIECVIIDLPHKISLGDEIYRRIFADGCQVIGQIRLLTVLLQFFAHGFLDLRQVLINAVQRSVFQKKACRRLRADARHTRDIIRAVAHETLEVDQAHGIEAILRPEHIRRVISRDGLTGFRCDELDRDAVRHQL